MTELKIDYSYKNISESIKKPEIENTYLNTKVVINQMINCLPKTSWANIELSDWLDIDDKLLINYHLYDSYFGEVLVANTSKGICYLGLLEKELNEVLSDLKKRFKHTKPIEAKTSLHEQAIKFLNGKIDEFLPLHLRGTPYQTDIWKKLIRIPYGKVISYETLGGGAQYSRAAGTANGRNPIFWIVPCQRVVKVTGKFDRYFWGEEVKKRLLAWEFANSIF